MGQTKVRTCVFIEAARAGGSADHVLFAGPGLGRRRWRRSWRASWGCYFRASGPVIAKAGDLAALLTNLEDRDILFIVKFTGSIRRWREFFCMEDYQLDLIIGEGRRRARCVSGEVPLIETDTYGATPLRRCVIVWLPIRWIFTPTMSARYREARFAGDEGGDHGRWREIAASSRGARIAGQLCGGCGICLRLGRCRIDAGSADRARQS